MKEYLIEDLGGLMVHYRATHDHQLADILDGAIAHIISIEAELKSREWISVDIEMPPEKSHGFSEWILVTTNHDGRKFVCQDKRDFHNDYWVQSSTNVTHWMPLPSPPENDNGN